ncbi:MAG: PKD domain-containing protein [bacterium]|nr:PKD domain-containing protein [bacterium]
MSLISKSKRGLKLLTLSVFIATLLGMNLTAHAFIKEFNEFFDLGEQGITFTAFEGKLAQLSAEGYDPALVVTTDFRDFVLLVVNFALGFLGLVAVIIVIYGGTLYVTAGGEEEKTQKGKKAITYAVIGLLIVLGSFAFVNTIIGGATGDSDTSSGAPGSGTLVGGGFNASAEQVRALAIEIFNGYIFLTEAQEDLLNIKNDVEKESLKPNNLPSKSSILAYLNSVKSKLKNMENGVPAFSIAKAEINEQIRAIDKDIDLISRTNGTIYIKQPGEGASSLDVCDVDEERYLIVDIGDSDQKICSETDPPHDIIYTKKLHETWKPIHAKYNEDTIYDNIIKPIAASYLVDLERIFGQLEAVYANFANIEVISTGKANTAHTAMQANTAFGYTVPADSTTDSTSLTQTAAGFMHSIDGWTLAGGISATGGLMMKGLEQMAIIYEELKTLQYVQSRLTADVVEGTAPLTVLFDTAGSIDPVGGSIESGKIIWDLGGSQSISELFAATKGTALTSTDVVDCEFSPTSLGTSAEDVIGVTAKRCTFKKPGTYRAAVRIDSKEPNLIAPGISILTIKVHPPTTQIELEVAGDDVMHYDASGVLVIDKSKVQVTQEDASKGIIFDASSTKADQYKIDYGDGESEGFLTDGKFTHSYPETGKYKVTLEVVNELGVIDKKIFTLEVTTLAARLNVSPAGKAFVDTQVVFDGSDSKSDIGKIISYKWTIVANIPPEMQGSNDPEIVKLVDEITDAYPTGGLVEQASNLQIFTHKFKYALKYDITLEVTDSNTSPGAKNTATETIADYQVESHPPVAIFEYSTPVETQPGTIYLDAKPSYDPDGTDNFSFEWTINPGVLDTDYEIEDTVEHGLNSEQPRIKFLNKGEYEVTLKITDKISDEEFSETSQTVVVDKTIDVKWGDDQTVTAKLDDQGNAKVVFIIESDNAETYEVDFGDGTSESGEIAGVTTTTDPHDYTETGKYPIKVIVYDEDGDENILDGRIFIGGGEKPIARARLQINGEDNFDVSTLEKPIRVSKKDVLNFLADESVDKDGKKSGINFSWDLGDTTKSSKKKVTHTYKEFSPMDPVLKDLVLPYEVKLKVIDKDDATKFAEDEIYIEVANLPPTFSSVQGVPLRANKNLITPVTMNMKVHGDEDEDGTITKYKWWYFDVDAPATQLGVQVTQAPSAQLVIGTTGREGEEITYGFGLEITDNDNATANNETNIENGNYSEITVTNGANEQPTAKMTVDAPSVFVGDQVTMTSSSEDPDGNIISYIWDIEGDGFHNNEPTDKASIQHVYESQNKEGYNVRLKVIDDKGGEAVSDPVTIHVDSLAEPPVAAFKYEVVDGSSGMEIKFTSNSKADEKAKASIIAYKWDFDTKFEDSDGDGEKNNDSDAKSENPKKLYSAQGVYDVKLIVTDDQGNEDDVTNTVYIPLAKPPKAAFTSKVKDGKVTFKNNSTSDEENGAEIDSYIWDFDTASALENADSDGDGAKDNDNDSSETEPILEYEQAGTYMVKLTVIDTQGNEDFVINEVNFALTAVADPITGKTMDPIGPGGGGKIKAKLFTDPSPGGDGVITIPGTSGNVKFDFSKSEGLISHYILDKNIYFDTNGNGIKNDDEDFKTVFPGTWSTFFDSAWGKIVVKLTVKDIHGNEDSTTVEIKFGNIPLSNI